MENFELHFESGEALSVRAYDVSEGLSQLFAAEVVAQSANADIDLAKFVGLGAGLHVLGGSRRRAWTGVCSRAEVHEGHLGEEEGQTTYLFTIVPHLWLLTQRTNHRVFQHQTAAEMVAVLLTEWNCPLDVRLTSALPPLEFRVQYNETDFAFASRILEESGVTYFFEEVEADGKTESRLVLADAPHAVEPRTPNLDYSAEAEKEQFVWQNKLAELKIAHSPTLGRVTLRDTDLRRSPAVPLFAKAVWEGESEAAERFEFSPGAFLMESGVGGGAPGVALHEPALGEHAARILLEASRSERERIRYRTRCLDVRPGTVFRVEHPRQDVSQASFLVTAARVHGDVSGEWELEGEAVSTAFPFRTPARTARPQLQGVQTAVVTGPAGKEIHTDEFGRVRVRFHWDRLGEYDDTRSPWVRVAHDWAGTGFGLQALPRVGQEVLLAFQGGDPDMPVVIGRLYSGTQVHPYALPENKTKSGIKTKSVPGAGYNAFVFDDTAGGEAVYLKAQRDQVRLVQGSDSEHTGGTASTSTGGNHIAVVGGSEQMLVKATHTVTAGGTTLEIKKDRIFITTGGTELVIDGPDVTIRANENLVVTGKNGVAIQGTQILINDGQPPAPYPQPPKAQSAGGASAPAAQSKKDGALDAPDAGPLIADEKVFRIPGAPDPAPAVAAPAPVAPPDSAPGAVPMAAQGFMPGEIGLSLPQAPSLASLDPVGIVGGAGLGAAEAALSGGNPMDGVMGQAPSVMGSTMNAAGLGSGLVAGTATAAAQAALTGGDVGGAVMGQAALGIASGAAGALTGSETAGALAGSVAALAASGGDLKAAGLGLAAGAAGSVVGGAVGDVAAAQLGGTAGALVGGAAGQFASGAIGSGGDIAGAATAAGTGAAAAGVGAGLGAATAAIAPAPVAALAGGLGSQVTAATMGGQDLGDAIIGGGTGVAVAAGSNALAEAIVPDPALPPGATPGIVAPTKKA